jgi:hypothetical protein
MGREEINIEELARKVDELLNVLKVISGDLSEVSKSLKKVSGESVIPVLSSSHSDKKLDINDVKASFSPELEGMLLYEETGKYIVVKPRRFLGSDNFAKIASIVRDLGGEYISEGKNSHFKISK